MNNINHYNGKLQRSKCRTYVEHHGQKINQDMETVLITTAVWCYTVTIHQQFWRQQSAL